MDFADYARTFQDLEDLRFLTFEGTDRRGRRIIRIVGKYFPAVTSWLTRVLSQGNVYENMFRFSIFTRCFSLHFLSLRESFFSSTNCTSYFSSKSMLQYINGIIFTAPIVDNIRLKDFIIQKICQVLPAEEEFCIVYFHSRVNRKDNFPGVITLRWLYETLPQEFRQRIQVVYFVHPGILSRTILGTLGRVFLSEGIYHKLNYISRIEFLWDHVKKGEMGVPDFVFSHDKELEHRPLMDYWIDSDPVNSYSSSTAGIL